MEKQLRNVMNEVLKLSPGRPDFSTVGRLSTQYWSDARGIHSKRSFTYLKRKSFGYNVISDGICEIGAKEVILRIDNWDTAPDGLYEVDLLVIGHDLEIGGADTFLLRLTPYIENEDKNETN